MKYEMKITEGYIYVRVPDRIVVDGEIYMWLEDTLGYPGIRYYWQDTPGGHFLHCSPEDMLACRLVFKI